MTTVRFLNGLETIGGNIAEFAEGDSRVIMDFGVPGDPDTTDTTALIQAAMLPNLPELFGQGQSKFQHEAIFISHLHIDHMGALKYLKTAIPVYLSRPSYDLYQLLIQSGQEQPVTNLHPIDFEQPISVGRFTVTGFESDHDVIGAMALLINDGHHYFAHSGDVRLNGPHPERVIHWAKTFAALHLKLFLLEGTTFSFDTETPQEDNTLNATKPIIETEATVQTHFAKIIDENTEELLVLNPYIRNVDRLNAFTLTAAKHGKQLVWGQKEAEIIHHFYPETALTILGENSQHDAFAHISLAEIKQHPTDFVLQNNFEDLEQLLAFDKVHYLHSNGEPLGDYDPRFQKLHDFLETHQIPITYLSATGHALRADLIRLANLVQAETVVPWHSFHPGREAVELDKTRSAVLLPERDLYYDFDSEN